MSTADDGFIYVLLNHSMPGMVKIGRTRRTAEQRAKELSGVSGVPTEFIVIYDELVSNARRVERRLHERFAHYRVHRGREFFRIPVKEAIKALQEEASRSQIDPEAVERISVLDRLVSKFSPYLRQDTIDVALLQTEGVCYIEIVRPTGGRDKLIEQVDLDFFGDDDHRDQSMFDPQRPIEENVERFLSLDAYSICMTLPLLRDDACDNIVAATQSGSHPGHS